ncbi:hypothetical protein JVU11DRAFT_3963 [Chiua virens]|nr:hypothetical protein JVU11DRAFT_3963 [Chiua virens]
MRIGDYTAHILVEGKELEEYDIEFPTETRATCWIASQEDLHDKWQCHAENRLRGNAGWVRVDGIFCGGVHMFPGHLGDGDDALMSVITTDTKTRDFMFVRIQLDDNDQLLNKEIPIGFGEISVEIEHGRLVRDHRRYQDDIEVAYNHNVFHETSNKGGHHRIGFGPEKSADDELDVYNLIVDDDPSLFFVFKYRPIALLRAHEIIPKMFPLVAGHPVVQSRLKDHR